MRNWLIAILIGLLIIISFLIWGDWFVEIFTNDGAISFLEGYGNWAWAAGILLLIGDLALPLPGTIIMSGLGYLYGPMVGGLLATIGNFLSGMLAFGLCRAFGKKGAERLLGKADLEKGKRIFTSKGGWIVAISRWLPIVPEVVACMAGLNQMKTKIFVIALICGSVPLGFVFAYIGHSGVEYPTIAIILSAVLPAILWIVAQYILRRLSKD